MEKEILEKMIEEYKDMEKIADKDFSELDELEKNPAVRRYLYLSALKNDRDIVEYGKLYIVDNIMKKDGYGAIKETNNIWCYMFETKAKNITGVFLPNIDKDKVVVVYWDLENNTKYVVIPKEEQKEFEAKNKVVYGNIRIGDYTDRYYNTRHKFFEDCIKVGQEEAVQKILTKTNQN